MGRRVLMLLTWTVLATVPGHDDPAEHVQEVTIEIARQPDDARLYLRRAGLLSELGRLDEALADLDRARQRAPGGADYDLLTGRVYRECGDPNAALAAFDRSVAASPNAPVPLRERARTRQAVGDLVGAATDWDAAVPGLAPLRPEDVLAQARCWRQQGTPEALRRCAEVLAQGRDRLGELPVLRATEVDVEIERGDIDSALCHLDVLIAASPRPEPWLVRRGDLLVAAGRDAEAVTAYGAALAAIDRLPKALAMIGDLPELRRRAAAGLP